jgi:hypothetical protein
VARESRIPAIGALRAVLRIGALIAAVGVAFPGDVRAEAQFAGEGTGPAVRLTAPQTAPGEETFVTVMLQKAPSTLQTLEVEIQFDPRQLTYIASRKAIAADLARAELEVKTEGVAERGSAGGQPPVEAPASKGPSRILLTIKGSRPIPDGPVAELRFRVAHGTEGVNIKVDQRVKALAADGSAIDAIVAEAGEIRVTSEEKPKAPVVFACFFYMH